MSHVATEAKGSFIHERLNETVAELKDVREKLKSMNDRLGEAESCIRFYADPRRYLAYRAEDGRVFQAQVTQDFSNADNDKNTFIAGRRAREYLKTHGLE